MSKAIENIEKELKAARDRSSTNNNYYYAYANGLEYALTQVKLFAIPDVVGQSEQFICPCCGSDKTYKTEAYHCNRCAVTTEV